jgi:hypothetical protein
MEEWKNGMMEKWKDGMVEEWKNGMVEWWKNGRMERWNQRRLCVLTASQGLSFASLRLKKAGESLHNMYDLGAA